MTHVLHEPDEMARADVAAAQTSRALQHRWQFFHRHLGVAEQGVRRRIEGEELQRVAERVARDVARYLAGADKLGMITDPLE